MKKMQTKQNKKKGKEKRALPRIKHSTSCVLAQFYTWNFRRQGPFPKPFHAWIKLQAIFLLLKPLKRNFIQVQGRTIIWLHVNYQEINQYNACLSVPHGTWLLLYKTSQQSLHVLFQLSACQCCSEPVEGTKMIINILRSKRATAKFSRTQPSQNARNRWLQGTGATV